MHMFALAATVAPTRALWAASPSRVIVIGAGIMGASIAYHMSKRGAAVTLLEKEAPAAGTTRNSFAWLNSSAKAPRTYYDFNLAGLIGWRRLELEIGPDLPVQWVVAWPGARPHRTRLPKAASVWQSVRAGVIPFVR